MTGRKLNRIEPLIQIKAIKISIVFILIGLFVVLLLMRFSIYRIKGNSMYDTIQRGDIVLIWQKLNLQNAFKKNEIVLFQTEINNEVIPYVKRITAIPNDRIKINSDELIIDDRIYPHDEIFYLMSDTEKTNSNKYITYLMQQSAECAEEKNARIDFFSSDTNISIPTQCYFMIGDNPYESMDSRFFGFIHEDRILGKVIAVF